MGVRPWWEVRPDVWDLEYEKMSQHLPGFQYGIYDTAGVKRLGWRGILSPMALYGGYSYDVLALYRNDHPSSVSHGSVRVRLLKPTIGQLSYEYRSITGQNIPHVLIDEIDGEYCLCTSRGQDVLDGVEFSTALSVLTWASKWLAYYESVVLFRTMTDDRFFRG